MPKEVLDPNPQLSWLEDGRVKQQIADLARRSLELAHRRQEAPMLSEEQQEAERWQAASNEMAEANPLYASARTASAHFLVVPLEGTEPLVRPADATRDARELFLWWDRWPSANPGILLGRAGGAFAIRIQDRAAWERLRDIAAVERHDEETDRRYVEYRQLGGAVVFMVKPSDPRRVAYSRVTWGRDLNKLAAELARESRPSELSWLVYSYPSPIAFDAFEFRSKTIATGVKLLGDHEVMPWGGSILEDGNRVEAAFSGRPPEAPLWLAKTIGKPRSRRVMTAAREGYEAALRVNEAHVIGHSEALRASAEAARRLALADHERATKALARAEREAERDAEQTA